MVRWRCQVVGRAGCNIKRAAQPVQSCTFSIGHGGHDRGASSHPMQFGCAYLPQPGRLFVAVLHDSAFSNLSIPPFEPVLGSDSNASGIPIFINPLQVPDPLSFHCSRACGSRTDFRQAGFSPVSVITRRHPGRFDWIQQVDRWPATRLRTPPGLRAAIEPKPDHFLHSAFHWVRAR
jgi:hypothetical protein